MPPSLTAGLRSCQASSCSVTGRAGTHHPVPPPPRGGRALHAPPAPALAPHGRPRRHAACRPPAAFGCDGAHQGVGSQCRRVFPGPPPPSHRPSRRRHAARLPPPAAVRRDAARQVVCSKTLVAKEGCEEEVGALCADIVAALAPAQPGGPPTVRGVLEARLLTDAANPRTFHLWERFDSNRTLGEVNTGEPYAAFMKRVVPLLEGPVGMALYEWKDGQLGAQAVQGGPKGEGGLDDATGGQGMAGGAGMKQTSAAIDLGNLERGEEGDAFGMPPAGGGRGKAGGGGDGDGGGGSDDGGPANLLEEFSNNLAKGFKAFKFPWEK